MPIDLSKLPSRLIEAVRRGNLVPLVGAGISRQSDPSLPDWRTLLEQMRLEAGRYGHLGQEEWDEITVLLNRGQFLMVAEELRQHLTKDQYHSFFESRFNPPQARPSDVHRTLFRLEPPFFMTTNYDKLLENAYAEVYARVPEVSTYRQLDHIQRVLLREHRPVTPAIFKLHGDISQPDSIVLSERDYRELIYRQPGYRLTLSAIFMTHVVLMLGFSLADRELLLILESIRESLKHSSSPDYIFLASDRVGKIEERRWREDFGVEVIRYEASPDRPEILELVTYLAEVAGDQSADTETRRMATGDD